jgi:hypothetical protein
MILRPNGGQATAKLRRDIGRFDRVSSKLKHLRVMYMSCSRTNTSCESVAANQGQIGGIVISDLERMRSHSAFSAAMEWQATIRDVDRCHEIAEKTPQSSRAPATFRWACA